MAMPVTLRVCPHLGDRNNDRTFRPYPHRGNACYARFHQRWSWWLLRLTTTPSRLDKEHQARYCFADYLTCPYFHAPGTPPELLPTAPP